MCVSVCVYEYVRTRLKYMYRPQRHTHAPDCNGLHMCRNEINERMISDCISSAHSFFFPSFYQLAINYLLSNSSDNSLYKELSKN